MAGCCTICLSEDVGMPFQCTDANCEYQLCVDCLQIAFNDLSGLKNQNCPMCNAPSAIAMAEARIGKGGVKAVQRELRETVELEVRLEQGLYKAKKEGASKMNDEALRLFNRVTEELNLNCPKCSMVFQDYDGCNALTCGNSACRAKFCAICLKDCGADAHSHVREKHGNLFDKKMFEKSKEKHFIRVIDNFLDTLKKEGRPSDLIQLVRNHLERAGHLNTAVPGAMDTNKARHFISSATKELERVIAADRSSILSESQGSAFAQVGIRPSDISPRAAVPEDVRIWLEKQSSRNGYYTLRVQAQIDGRLVTAPNLEEVTEWIKNGFVASAGPLATLAQSMRCAVIALEGARTLYQVRQVHKEEDSAMKIQFKVVNRGGGVNDDLADDYTGPFTGKLQFRMLAINPNDRHLRLLQHIKTQVTSQNLPTPLKHFLGEGAPAPVVFELEVTVPETRKNLNEQQQKAGNPLLLKSAGEVAGPPGTGKTKTITELVRALLHCTTKDIVVLSERNGAIDAIAEKFALLCTKEVGKKTKVKDMQLWKDIETFGSADAMGESSKLFLLESKIRDHPEIIEVARVENDRKAAYKQLRKNMLKKVAEDIKEFGDKFQDDMAWNQHKRILGGSSNSEDLANPHRILHSVKRAIGEAECFMDSSSPITQKELDDFITSNSPLVQNLFPLDFVKKEAKQRMQDITRRFTNLLKLEDFNAKLHDEVRLQLVTAEQTRQATEVRVRQELSLGSRLKMSTIGSSHKLFKDPEDSTDADIITERFSTLEISNKKSRTDNGVVIIFDESGCIPSFELLGLNRLDCQISAILAVGDKNQLPPYDPSNASKKNKKSPSKEKRRLKSLLDVSEVKDKIFLCAQYRVPRDIARILDARVYSGRYNTHPRAPVPNEGLQFHHVTKLGAQERRKYVNTAEVNAVLDLAERKAGNGNKVMILTPYKNQQREIQWQIKRKNIQCVAEASVLTIDQCQGQEAEIVIFTLVQKPTRFLNKNRMNVAISRTREELIIVGDRLEFRKASEDLSWESAFIAKDIIDQTNVMTL